MVTQTDGGLQITVTPDLLAALDPKVARRLIAKATAERDGCYCNPVLLRRKPGKIYLYYPPKRPAWKCGLHGPERIARRVDELRTIWVFGQELEAVYMYQPNANKQDMKHVDNRLAKTGANYVKVWLWTSIEEKGSDSWLSYLDNHESLPFLFTDRSLNAKGRRGPAPVPVAGEIALDPEVALKELEALLWTSIDVEDGRVQWTGASQEWREPQEKGWVCPTCEEMNEGAPPWQWRGNRCESCLEKSTIASGERRVQRITEIVAEKVDGLNAVILRDNEIQELSPFVRDNFETNLPPRFFEEIVYRARKEICMGEVLQWYERHTEEEKEALLQGYGTLDRMLEIVADEWIRLGWK